jgi:hypothetical protein
MGWLENRRKAREAADRAPYEAMHRDRMRDAAKIAGLTIVVQPDTLDFLRREAFEPEGVVLDQARIDATAADGLVRVTLTGPQVVYVLGALRPILNAGNRSSARYTLASHVYRPLSKGVSTIRPARSTEPTEIPVFVLDTVALTDGGAR